MNTLIIHWSNSNWPGPVDGLRIQVWDDANQIVDDDTLPDTADSHNVEAQRGHAIHAIVSARFEAEYYEQVKEFTATVPALLNASGGGLWFEETEV